jgi:hypothetical protein
MVCPPDPLRATGARGQRWRAARWAVVAIVALAACGGAAGGRTADDTGRADDEPIDPIAEFFGFGRPGDDDQQRFREQQRRVEELVRQCMAAEGFDYIPMDPPDMGAMPGEGLTQREFAERYGYGMSTFFEESMEEAEEFVDPNADQVETMTDEQRRAWEEALYGPPSEQPQVAEGEDETVVFEGFGGGCQGEAAEAVYGGEQDAFTDLFRNYQEALEADPRWREAAESWRECMAAEGYDFAEPEDAIEAVNERAEELYQSVDPFPGLTEEEIAALSPEELEATTPPEPDPELLAETKEFELAVAVADYDCQGDLRRATAEVGREYLDAHRGEFERARDAMEDHSS